MAVWRRPVRVLERLRRAFGEFLAIPVGVVVAFLALALLVYAVDASAGRKPGWGEWWLFLARYVGDSASATSLLTTIAGSLITVTSITFSILLLAVQQGASALTSQIIDHYLRRHSNQFYFGFFVGTSVFALVTLVLTTSGSQPVLGVTFATMFAAAALFALILLIYSTIDQIRPVTIINEMHDVALAARGAQRGWLAHTSACGEAEAGRTIVSGTDGYLARVRARPLEAAAREAGVRVVVRVRVGDYVLCGAPIADIVSAAEPGQALVRRIERCLPIEERRDLACDAAFGVDQLTTIAWTSISTAKSNPAAGAIACRALGDILFRWSGDPPPRCAASPVSYGDEVFEQLMDGIEDLVVVASESMQHQSLSLVMDLLAAAFPRMQAPERDRAEQILLTSLSALADHVPTRRLGASFARAVGTLRAAGRDHAADQVSQAWTALASSRGGLHARGSRD